MTGRRAAPQSGAGPIAAVLARAGGRVNAEWLERLAGRFDAVFVIGSAEGPEAVRAGAAAEWVADGDDVLDRIAAAHPDRPVLLLRAGLELPGRFGDVVEAVAGELERTGAVAFPGNYDARFDPLAGLESGGGRLDRLVEWSSDRVGQHVENPSPECLLLAPGHVSGHPRALGIESAFVPDTGYVVDPDRETGRDEAGEDGVESDAFDPILGHLRRRVASLLAEGVESLPEPGAGAVTLHVTHSWGGGVWRWIEDLIAGDPDAIHLVLVAVSDGPGRLCGRYLKLCAAGPGRGVIRELALAPRIGAVATGHAGYREHLEAIIERFDVARIIVSSPVGHSLDCLRTGLPTIAVLHDFFPLWPLLEHDPLPFLEPAGGDPSVARTEALSQHGASMRLRPADPGFWDRIAKAWLAAVDEHRVALASPTRHVIERWRALAGDRKLDIECIPHGFRPFSGPGREGRTQTRRAVLPEPGDRPLHLVIPGRLSEGKGLRLLEQALPELSGLARVTALGCGRSGLALMGRSGIDLIPEYRRDELPALIDALA
ncbi:MAG: hypothetical protein RQ847_06215, partial [Wenzhouxiangellaceae bacterium]|nr:hypothetical protein [Wenzhouxiangellaceae bacterium]